MNVTISTESGLWAIVGIQKVPLHSMAANGCPSGEIRFVATQVRTTLFFELVDWRYSGCVDEKGRLLGPKFKVTQDGRMKRLEGLDLTAEMKVYNLIRNGETPYVSVDDRDGGTLSIFGESARVNECVPAGRESGTFTFQGLAISFVRTAFRHGTQIELRSDSCRFRNWRGERCEAVRIVRYGATAIRPGTRIYLGTFAEARARRESMQAVAV